MGVGGLRAPVFSLSVSRCLAAALAEQLDADARALLTAESTGQPTAFSTPVMPQNPPVTNGSMRGSARLGCRRSILLECQRFDPLGHRGRGFCVSREGVSHAMLSSSMPFFNLVEFPALKCFLWVCGVRQPPTSVNWQPSATCMCGWWCGVCMCGWFTKSDPACGDTAQGGRRLQSGVGKVGRDRARGGGDQTAALWRELQPPPMGMLKWGVMAIWLQLAIQDFPRVVI